MRKTFILLASVLISSIITGQDSQMSFEEKVAYDLEHSNKINKPQNTTDVIDAPTGSNTVLFEDFESGIPPTGWTVINNAAQGPFWTTAAASGESNYCGTGEAATCSSDNWGTAHFDTELITPPVFINHSNTYIITYLANYQNFANEDYLNLDIYTDANPVWNSVLSWNEDHGLFKYQPGEFVSLNLTHYLSGASYFQLRWHYFDPTDFDWDWYAQIDDVHITSTPLIPVSSWALAIGIFLIVAATVIRFRRIS